MSLIEHVTIKRELKVNIRQIYAITTCLIMLLSVLAVLNMMYLSPMNISTSVNNSSTNNSSPTVTANNFIDDNIGQVITNGYTDPVPINPYMQLTVLVGLKFTNPTLLNNYLTDVQNPSSVTYHRYLSKQQFQDYFSPDLATYSNLGNYFTKSGLTVNSYPDRVTIKLTGSVAQFENIFHTKIMDVTWNGKTFYAPVKSLSLNTDVSSISSIIGLNNYIKAKISSPISDAISLFEQSFNTSYVNDPSFCSTYQINVNYCSTQVLYGSDMQKAYQLDQLISPNNYPFNKTIATILWSGQTYSGTNVGPFVPSDIANYLSSTLPASQPQPQVDASCASYDQTINQSYICGHPVDGAPAPGSSAMQDYYQTNFESTLDLEMAGSVAPGANVVEVYGPAPYTNYLDDAFATILNAPTSDPLSHTVAISNSWGTNDDPGYWGEIIDPLWQQYTQEAAALGITVVASSGDTPNSNGQTPGYPASVAYDNFGVVSVGGTQTYLTGTNSSDGSGTTGILNQTVWFGSPSFSAGSQGGVSVSYSEPIWQKQSFDANNVIKSSEPQISGRGTPDIAAVASNMNINISFNTYSSTGVYQNNYPNVTIPLWGTSVASPLVAGVVADMDQYLGYSEGYFESVIYQLGQAQFDGLYSSSKPFSDVSDGYNYLFTALPGYDLVTGWGSINAFNFIQAQLAIKTITFTEIGLSLGSTWSVTLDNSATISSSTSNITFMAETGSHIYSIYNVLGHFSNVTQGSVTMANSNINIPIAFSSSLGSGKGIQTVVAENDISNKAAVNFTISGSTDLKSDLPISELFNITSDSVINTISLYLNGTGQVAVSIGTNLWQDDVLAPITLNVNGQGWYNVSFSAITLRVANYYLNVWIANPNYNYVSWGFINNAVINTPTSSIGDLGSFSNMTLFYPYNVYTLDSYHPAIYSLSLRTQPPAIMGPTNTISVNVINSDTISWQVASSFDNYGSQSYNIFKNNTNIVSGTWASNNNITITNKEPDPGLFNYTLLVTDAFGSYAVNTVWVNVTGSANGNYTSTVTSTKVSTTTTTETKPVTSTTTQTETVSNPQGNVTVTTTQIVNNTVNNTGTEPTKNSSTPGFELLITLLGLSLVVTLVLRRRKK